MTAIIDYDAGNLRSVEKALLYLNDTPVISRDPEVLLTADGVILPGVGAFGDAMEKLEGFGLVPVIRELVEKKIPLLGICLGQQLLFEGSEEAPGVSGLGLLPGKIERIPDKGLKVPHMGWNSLTLKGKATLFQSLNETPYVYFVHSYYLPADNPYVCAVTEYGVPIGAAVEKELVFGCQFHPEKSSRIGLSILKSFCGISREVK